MRRVRRCGGCGCGCRWGCGCGCGAVHLGEGIRAEHHGADESGPAREIWVARGAVGAVESEHARAGAPPEQQKAVEHLQGAREAARACEGRARTCEGRAKTGHARPREHNTSQKKTCCAESMPMFLGSGKLKRASTAGRNLAMNMKVAWGWRTASSATLAGTHGRTAASYGPLSGAAARPECIAWPGAWRARPGRPGCRAAAAPRRRSRHAARREHERHGADGHTVVGVVRVGGEATHDQLERQAGQRARLLARPLQRLRDGDVLAALGLGDDVGAVFVDRIHVLPRDLAGLGSRLGFGLG